MREIKFRAWDDLNRKWLLGYEYKNLGGFSLTGECVLLGEWGNVFDTFLFGKDGKKWDDLKIMQFTGLKDKNGVEIYEGDNLKRITVFEDGGCDFHLGIITYDDFGYYSRSIKNEISRSLGGKSDNTTYEVIGNIHENPELINK